MSNYFANPQELLLIARWPVCATCRRMYTGSKTTVPRWIKQKEYAGECALCLIERSIESPEESNKCHK